MNDEVAELFEELDLAVPERLMSQLEEAMQGDFELIRPLARGGMGIVFLARDIRLDRVVAVKVLQADVFTTKSEIQRFKQEARTVAALDHPHIVPVYSVREAEELFLYIMRYIDGQTLEQLINEGPVDAARVTSILLHAATALELAHSREVVHRDIKPANLIVDTTGCTYIMDFGIARVSDGSGLTQAGAFVGTPNYASPEQCRGEAATALSDQYALGVVAYELLRGQAIFEADSMAGMLQHHLHTPPPDLGSLPVCPPKLAYAIERMVAKVPEARWPSMTALIDYLSDGESGGDIRRTALSLRAVSRADAPEGAPGPSSPSFSTGETLSTEAVPPSSTVSAPRWSVPAILALLLVAGAGLVTFAALQGGAADPVAEPMLPPSVEMPAVEGPVEGAGPAVAADAEEDEGVAPDDGESTPAEASPVQLPTVAEAEPDPPPATPSSETDPPVAAESNPTAAAPIEPVAEAAEETQGPGAVLLGTRGARAVLYVDGESQGAASRLRTWEVPSGSRALTLRAEGCAPWDTTVVVIPGETVRLGYRMQGCLSPGGEE